MTQNVIHCENESNPDIVPYPNNVFTGVDGDYWGTLTFDVTGLVTEPEVTTTINNDDPENPDSPDCLLWAATLFSVASEAPDDFLYIPYLIHGVITPDS